MLTVYTAAHCPVFGRTQNLVAQLHQDYPQIPLKVVDLDDPAMYWPPYVIGTPTYVWNEQIVFMGNPSKTDLIAKLSTMQAL